jgi:hypothetical protein
LVFVNENRNKGYAGLGVMAISYGIVCLPCGIGIQAGYSLYLEDKIFPESK